MAANAANSISTQLREESPTTLIITRHVITDFNNKGIVQGGRSNTKPAVEGYEQAIMLAEELVKYKIDIVYSSPMDRCVETIAPFVQKTGIRVNYVKELSERDYGIFDGKSAESYTEWKNANNIKENFDYKPPEGESFRDVMIRVGKKVNEIIEDNKGKSILICGHNSVDVALCLGLFKQQPETNYKDYMFDNASLTIITIKDGKPEIVLKNQTEHLKPAKSVGARTKEKN